MIVYSSLKSAALDLDEALLPLVAGFSIETRPAAHVVRFRFALYGPSLDGGLDYEQFPDVEALLERRLDPRSEIADLESSEMLGGFDVVRAPSGSGAGGDPAIWLVKTHAASQAERIRWRRSIT